jgi:phthiocerol/phenolphthiocerol synthesis type-I polyketide synthase E
MQPDSDLFSTKYIPPSTPTEEVLSAIWSQVLGVEVGRKHNFFEAGGDSLNATQIIVLTQKALGVLLTLNLFFESPTIAELSSRIEALHQAEPGLSVTTIEPASRSTELLLSFPQQRMWFFEQFVERSATYSMHRLLHLVGYLNVAALAKSLTEIVRRHEILRTTFRSVNGAPMQVIAASLAVTVPMVDLQHLLGAEQAAEVQRLANYESQQPFDLVNGPLLRVTRLQLAEQSHVLLITMHHIIGDGWSWVVFFRELGILYQAFFQGEASPLPELPIQYADFACWQRQWFTGELLETQLIYWKQQLAGAPPLLELPTDRSRPSIQTFRGATESFNLSVQLTQKLKTFSQKSGVTLFMTLLAAFFTLLHRYSGQSDIVIGSPIANRHRSEIEPLIGFFVNTLALRIQGQGNPTFADLLAQVRQITLDAHAHQDFPFERLVEVLQPERSASYTPIFQVMFVLQNTPPEKLELPNLTLTALKPKNNTAKFDLTLSLKETETGISGEWEYSSDLFEAATVHRMIGHLQTLLAGIVANPEYPVSKLPLLTESERHQLLVEWNNTQIDYPEDKCIHQIFEAQVERTPDAVAVVFEEQQLTYRELNCRANQLAQYLQTLGVSPEVLVGICVEPSIEMIVGILGIFKAGGAYVPLDPDYPQERLAYIVSDSQVSVLVTQKKLVDQCSDYQGLTVCLDTDWEEISRQSQRNLTISVHPHNLVYVIYTSGSTGQPKGVLIQHQGLCNQAKALQIELDIQPDSRVLQFFSFGFDGSIWAIVKTLVAGATLVLAKKESLLPGKGLIQLLQDAAITIILLPPAVLKLLPLEDLPSLRTILVAGEACSIDLVTRWASGRRFFNAYGPTETTVCATVAELTDGSQSITIGRPIANTQVYLLDVHLQPVPIGVSGELYIGGVGLARGYANRPDLTSERFISNPFNSKQGERIYKTGDLARYLADGNIEYLDRTDRQVKIRGFRIELDEIQVVLEEHPDVEQCLVIAQEDRPGDKRLVGYIISKLIPERLLYESECVVEIDNDKFLLRTRDISQSSVKLVGTTPEFSPGKPICLRLLLPGASEAIYLQGTVEWCQEQQAGIALHLDPTEQALIDRGIDYLLESPELWQSLQRTANPNFRDYLQKKLPNYMVPSAFVLMKAFPLTPNGKVNHRALPVPQALPKDPLAADSKPKTELEKILATVWQEILQLDTVGIHDNFFDLGGHSLLLVQVHNKLSKILEQKLSIVDLLQYPTIQSLANLFSQESGQKIDLAFSPSRTQINLPRKRTDETAIAIIGMAGRFPGAKNIDEFWQNLQNGVESISFFSNEELLSLGVNQAMLEQPNYVKASGFVPDSEMFDASFFGFSPREAEVTDPQHRLLLECAWEAIEDAGYDTATYSGKIGVYAGAGMNNYLLKNLAPHIEWADPASSYQITISNEKDFLSTRVAYKLNLKGPAINVQTACSTSLVAVHVACSSLLNGECDMALAGGVSLKLPQEAGYLYQQGMILSPNGHCRAFDAKAQGTVRGNGAGVVVLKRLNNAIASGDHIYAVIKGSAINNDGSLKVGYTAPSVEGQAAVIAAALATAGVEPEAISYIESHGTGTLLGDPIEIAALTKAFRSQTQKKGFCAIGSVKTNVGHLDTAAGVTGLIKAALALKHKLLPPSLHFEEPNPQIDFANSPFYVSTKLMAWETNDIPRRAGVSSFGIGGTNVHLVLEESPVEAREKAEAPGRKCQLLVLSAKTSTALDKATANLAEYLKQHLELNLADVAYTLSKGRKAFNHRRVVVCQNIQDAIASLTTLDSQRVFTNVYESKTRPVAFMFSGQGSQYVHMTRELYEVESTFRQQVNLCCEFLKPHLQLDLRDVLYPRAADIEAATEQLKQTAIAQPALFVIEYALATLWMEWGVYPTCAIGHSIGEYVAACLAGVFSLEDALALVAMRGKLMQQMPTGAMLAVPLPEPDLQLLLEAPLEVALINGPSNCVVSGSIEAIDTLQSKLTFKGIGYRRLQTSHAFHSQMMEPILKPFTQWMKKVNLQSPQFPYISNVTGTWIAAEQATDPYYWAKHLRSTVRFAEGLQQLFQKPEQILLEIGPGRSLSTLAKQHSHKSTEQIVLTSTRHPQEHQSDVEVLLTTLGRLWLAGVEINWSEFYRPQQPARVPLPTYPFERQRYWIAPPSKLSGLTVKPVEKVLALPKSEITPSTTEEEYFSPQMRKSYVPPRNQTEQKVAETWQQFFKLPQVGIYDNFFELGGDSLLALQLISKLRDALLIELSPNSLLSQPTIAELAELIEATPPPSGTLKVSLSQKPDIPSCLVEIQKGNSLKPPLFLIHPVGGHVYFYRYLAQDLGTEQPVYGLQAQGIDGKAEPLTEIEAMATQYIEAMRLIQPTGPYYIGGASFGGMVGFEIAQQLHQQEEVVALLAMLDTPGPGQLPDGHKVETDAQILAYFIKMLGDGSVSLDDIHQLEPDEQMRKFLKIRNADQRFSESDLKQFRHLLHIFKVNVRSMLSYIPKVYPGRIVFFRARERDDTLPHHPERAWIDLAFEGIEIHQVPGNHITMNQPPHVSVLAEKLKVCLK